MRYYCLAELSVQVNIDVILAKAGTHAELACTN
jgi:hypothetical protein